MARFIAKITLLREHYSPQPNDQFTLVSERHFPFEHGVLLTSDLNNWFTECRRITPVENVDMLVVVYSDEERYETLNKVFQDYCEGRAEFAFARKLAIKVNDAADRILVEAAMEKQGVNQ